MNFPRQLRSKERYLLEFVLPAESSGYNEYRNHIANILVLGEGRRGKGNFVLGKHGDRADITSPLASVIAYGVVETTLDMFTITVRKFIGDPPSEKQESGGQICRHACSSPQASLTIRLFRHDHVD